MSQTKAQLISDLVQALNFTGTSSAPANGAFLSAANTLALATNSAQRLTIDSSGNVGVGTVTPTGTLSLSDQNPNIRFDDEDTSNNGEITLDNTQLRIEVDEDNAVSSSAISFRLDGSEKASIDANGLNITQKLLHEGDNDTFLEFLTNTICFDTAGSERMRINSSGDVGIGTTSPNTKLDVRDSSATGISSRSTNTQTTDSNKGLKVRNNSDTDTFSVSYKGQGYFAGKLGIGTTSPGSELHVSALGASDEPTFKVSSENSTIFLRTAGSSGSFPTGGGGNDGELLYLGGDFRVGVGTASKNLIFFNGSGYTERMRIDSSGRVGIGTNSPDSTLHVHKASAGTVSADGNAVLALENNNHCVLNIMTPADKSAYIMMGDPDDINAGQIRYDNNINELLVEVNGSERFRIDDSGNVGIGTSSPTSALHISDSNTSGGIRLIDSSTSAGAPNLEIISKRSDSNNNTAFASNIFLGKNRTDAKVSSGIILGTINFGGNHTDGSESNISYSASIRGVASDSFDSKTDMPTDLVFCTGTSGADRTGESAGNSNVGTERMRITDNGEVRIGNTGSIGQGTNGTMIPTVGIIKHSRAVGGGSATFQTFGNLGKFQTLGDGDAQNTNNSYSGTSDQELKENIVDANSQWDDIKALKVRNYNFKESTGYSTHKQIGVIAQELEALGMNSLVKNNDEEGYKSVKYSVLYMKAIKALQEAMAKIETLETKVAALEAA